MFRDKKQKVLTIQPMGTSTASERLVIKADGRAWVGSEIPSLRIVVPVCIVVEFYSRFSLLHYR